MMRVIPLVRSGGADDLDRANKAEIETLRLTLRGYLEAAGMKPELLGRFSRIIPYRALSSGEILEIADREIKRLVGLFNDRHNIRLHIMEPKYWSDDIYPYTATDLALYVTFVRVNPEDSNQGGARNVLNVISNDIRDSITEALANYPSCKEFDMGITQDSKIYNYQADATEGGIYVVPTKSRKR